jgi:hypothetical protein
MMEAAYKGIPKIGADSHDPAVSDGQPDFVVAG